MKGNNYSLYVLLTLLAIIGLAWWGADYVIDRINNYQGGE